MEGLSWKTACLSALCIFLFLRPAAAIRFVIDREDCFSHNVEYEGDTVHVSFVVIKADTPWHYSDKGADLVVKDPNGAQVRDSRDKISDKFEFIVQKRGVHRFCFTNKSPYHETIDFDVHVGHFSYFDQHAKDEHFAPLFEQIAKLDEACGSTALLVSEDGKKVGRANELLKPDEVIEQVDSRTIAASPLPHIVILEDVESFFAQYGKVNSVRLPRHVSDKRHFCGTALIEFSEEDEAKGVSKNNLVFAGADLEIRPKKEFDAERGVKRKAFEKSKNSPEGYPKGQVLAFKLKKISGDRDTIQNDGDKVDDTDISNEEGASNATEKSSLGLGHEEIPENKDMNEEKSDGVGEVKRADAGETAQSIDKDDKSLSNNDQDIILREDIKEEFTKFGTVRYVDFRKGEDSGYIRFEESTASERARAFAALQDEGGFIMKGHIVTLESVTGQAEKEYWSAIQGRQEKHKDNRSNKGRDWQSNRGGKRGRNFDSHERTSNKAQKV